MRVIVINGKPTAGKSTFIKLCEQLNPFVEELSMVDFVKEVATYADWDGLKNEKGRKFLANIKIAIEQYDKNIIYNHINDDIKSFLSFCNKVEEDPIFFINARNPSDIKYLVNKYNAVSLFIDNPNVPMVESNSEDKNIENYKYDITIINDGTLEDLKVKAKEFLSSLK